ncbi:MAG TPA: hypothetical protein VFE92_11895 [Dermatophilaceae bacterium]|jgi:hypothetical protein|nr:hypothetical protein [Dermatophilaceae bacterium]
MPPRKRPWQNAWGCATPTPTRWPRRIPGTSPSASLTFTPGSAGGPANVVATGTGTIKVTANGKQVAIYQNLTFITGPLIQAQVVAGSFGTPVPPSFMKPLVAAVATRAAKG